MFNLYYVDKKYIKLEKKSILQYNYTLVYQ